MGMSGWWRDRDRPDGPHAPLRNLPPSVAPRSESRACMSRAPACHASAAASQPGVMGVSRSGGSQARDHEELLEGVKLEGVQHQQELLVTMRSS